MKNDQKLRKTTTTDLSVLTFGKVPPQAPDLEEAVLGALMLEKDAFFEIAEILREDSFYRDDNQKIFNAIKELRRNGKPNDFMMVCNALRESGDLEICGGDYRITDLTNRVATAANIAFHARIIEQKAIARRIIRISSNAATLAYDDTNDIFEVADKLRNELFLNVDSFIVQTNINPADRINGTINIISEAYQKNKSGEMIGIPTGSMELDNITGGWYPGDLIVIAGRPSMGKTAYGVHCARAAVKNGYPTVFFSVEMTKEQLDLRFIAAETNIDYGKIRRGQIESYELDYIEKTARELGKMPLYIDDDKIDTDTLKTKVYKYIMENDIKFVVIDFLTQMTKTERQESKPRSDQAYSDMVRAIKAVAKETKIPIVLLSQLSRQVEGRGGSFEPRLSDLKETGSIEEAADVIIFPFRPEYYELKDETGMEIKDETWLLVRKNRQGDNPIDIKMGSRISTNTYFEINSSTPPIKLISQKIRDTEIFQEADILISKPKIDSPISEDEEPF